MNALLTYSIFLFIIAIALWIVLLFWYLRSRHARDISAGLGLQLFLVTIPENISIKENGGDPKETVKNFISQMEQFLSGLTMPKRSFRDKFWGPPIFALEIAAHNRGTEIFFYVAFPRLFESLLMKQLHGSFPEAKIERVPDYNVFNPMGATAGAILQSGDSQLLSIKTYKDFAADPLETITSAFSRLSEYGEGAAMQIVLRALGNDIARRGHKAVSGIKEGKSRKEVLAQENLWDIFKKTAKKSDKQKSGSYDEDFAKLLESKATKIIYDCNVRLLASSKTVLETDSILNDLEAPFREFKNPEGNSFKVKKLGGRALKKLIEQFSFRTFNPKNSILLSVEEIASIYHFPFSKKAAPSVRMLRAKESAPPVNLPQDGLIIGKSSYRGEEQTVRFKKDDRRRHFYAIGQTGTGKSTLLHQMIVQDIQNGEGVAVIDPHGDLIDKVLAYIPRERADDVIYFDPGDVQHPMGLNMLEFDPRFPEQRSLIVNELLEIFNKLFNMSIAGGPQFEQYFRNATMLVMEDPESGNTLFDIERIFADKAYRDYKLSKSTNIVVETFWKQIAERTTGDNSLQNMATYIVSKFDTFLSNEIMRPIMLQEKSAFNVRNVMDEGKILLLNLSKGKLGELNSSLLGLIMVGKILLAALSRVDTPDENKRRDFYLYIDEFQNVTTKSIATILSEARKYRLDLTITHQFIGQLEEDIKKAVFGNVGTMCSFRIGADDAEYMEKQFAPVFSAHDLLNIDNLNAYFKLLIDGQTSKPFNIKIGFPPPGSEQMISYLKELSRQKFSRPREEIEAEIRERHKALT